MQRIAAAAPESMQPPLLELAGLCVEYPEHAIALWLRLKQGLLARRDRLVS